MPRDAVDEAIAVTGTQAKRSDGKLPTHVMVYFAMAMAMAMAMAIATAMALFAIAV